MTRRGSTGPKQRLKEESHESELSNLKSFLRVILCVLSTSAVNIAAQTLTAETQSTLRLAQRLKLHTARVWPRS